MRVSGKRKRGTKAICVIGKHQGKGIRLGFQKLCPAPDLSFPLGGIDMVITSLTAHSGGALDTLATHLSTEGEGHRSYFMKKKAGSPPHILQLTESKSLRTAGFQNPLNISG